MKAEYKAEKLKSPSQELVTSDCAQESLAPLNEGDDVRRTLTSKVCKNCSTEKPLSEFYFNKTKDTHFSECKVCNKLRSSKWNKQNKEQYKNNCKNHKMNNPSLYKEYKKKEYNKNIEKYKQNSKAYRNSKHGKGVRQALGRERELAKSHATPKWLTKEQRQQMKDIYINRPKGFHVDHIHPLKGENFCGLHVPWNLQYLPAAENIRKRNKLL